MSEFVSAKNIIPFTSYWIPASQPPEPCEAEEYEVWLDFPTDDGFYSTKRMYALYYIEDRDEEAYWFDRNGNCLENVTHYRTLPAPPEVADA